MHFWKGVADKQMRRVILPVVFLFVTLGVAADDLPVKQLVLPAETVGTLAKVAGRVKAGCEAMVRDMQDEVARAQRGTSTKAKAETMVGHVKTCQEMLNYILLVDIARLMGK